MFKYVFFLNLDHFLIWSLIFKFIFSVLNFDKYFFSCSDLNEIWQIGCIIYDNFLSLVRLKIIFFKIEGLKIEKLNLDDKNKSDKYDIPKNIFTPFLLLLFHLVNLLLQYVWWFCFYQNKPLIALVFLFLGN